MQPSFANQLAIGLLLVSSLVGVILGSERSLQAAEETESLGLIVQTIADAPRPEIQAALLRGMLAGLAGRRDVTAPDQWKEFGNNLHRSEDSEVRELAARLAAIFGDKQAKAAALAILKNSAAELPKRRTALRSLLAQRSIEASDLLEGLLDEETFALDAIRGYSVIENAAAPSILLERYADFSQELQRATIETLATRKRYGQALVAAISAGTVPRNDVPRHVARSLRDLLGQEFTKDLWKNS